MNRIFLTDSGNIKRPISIHFWIVGRKKIVEKGSYDNQNRQCQTDTKQTDEGVKLAAAHHCKGYF